MSILSITTDSVGQIGVNPRRVKIISDDIYGVITSSNYLVSAERMGYQFYPTDFFDISYSNGSNGNILGIFVPVFSNGDIQLAEYIPPNILSGVVGSYTPVLTPASGVSALDLTSAAYYGVSSAVGSYIQVTVEFTLYATASFLIYRISVPIFTGNFFSQNVLFVGGQMYNLAAPSSAVPGGNPFRLIVPYVNTTNVSVQMIIDSSLYPSIPLYVVLSFMYQIP